MSKRDIPYAYRRDIPFNFELDETGDLKPLTDIDAINQSIYIILATNWNDKIMSSGNFGANLEPLLFSNDTPTISLLEYSIRENIIESLQKYEPDITVKGVTVTNRLERENSLIVSVAYLLKDNVTEGEFETKLQIGENIVLDSYN